MLSFTWGGTRPEDEAWPAPTFRMLSDSGVELTHWDDWDRNVSLGLSLLPQIPNLAFGESPS